jgi:hypothetical protein
MNKSKNMLFFLDENQKEVVSTALSNELSLSNRDYKALSKWLSLIPLSVNLDQKINLLEGIKSAYISGEARLILEDNFASKFHVSKIIHTINAINDLFAEVDFCTQKVYDFGPGQFAFALLARHLGANVTCLDKNWFFIKSANLLELEIKEVDYIRCDQDFIASSSIDGLWLKGSFSPHLFVKGNFDVMEAFVEKITNWMTPKGWGFIAPNARLEAALKKISQLQDAEYGLNEAIETQRRLFESQGWIAIPMTENFRKRYGFISKAYTSAKYAFIKNLVVPDPED